MNVKGRIRNGTGLIISALLFALILLPVSAFAGTPAGTVITNIATVTWDGGGSDTASATVTINFAEATPILTYVSTAPGTSVGESTAMTLTYSLTSQANGTDTYNLVSSVADNPGVLSPAPATTVTPGSLSLGGTAAISVTDDGTSTTITIPSGSANHGLIAESAPGLADGSHIVINGYNATTYPVTAVSDGATNTITILGVPAIVAGDLVLEQKDFTVAFTTGALLSGTSGIHAVTTTARDDAAAQPAATIATATDDDVTVVKAALTLAKTASVANAVPGDPVTYSITATNGGSTDATTVRITDPIQLFTTFGGTVTVSTTPAADSVQYSETGSGGPWIDIGTPPSSNAAVTHVRATWNTLSSVVPNNTANLTFGVTID